MIPKEKAQELLNRFYCVPDARGLYMMQEYQAKECALIAVDDIINELYECGIKNRWEYWQKVKREIENL